ncbi:ATP-binding cassette domain-containing protein [Chitinophaga horti]|uniref:ATP-binding cassette domain-containing protein n=1 Tax=Chitinophaga horti TaxID=2920382 RepID=A0ABY6IWI8_9BACT|nr:ABC-F family ATP-binding cassette domain-containing protein [Chitinophaga horti]UYQ91731.1 ATP-binding cassette domain-containing protein [Chitinophaga horti]
MLTLQSITYLHPNRDVLFENLHLSVQAHEKIALIGNNGAGKSTLLRLIAGILTPVAGIIRRDAAPYYVPQHTGQYNDSSVAEALGIDRKLKALQSILAGDVSEANMTVLEDDWTIEERCTEAFAEWGLSDIDLFGPMAALSGGQKTKVFLAGIRIHQPELVLMDEPSNHLDAPARQQLYDYITNTRQTLVVVSHDRTLLNLIDTVCELDRDGITRYGGNYDFYVEQKELAAGALQQDVKSMEKALRKARETEREAIERQQKLDARGKKKQEKAGLPTISMNTFRNNAEKSTARLKGVHADKIDNLSQELQQLRAALPDMDKMKIDLDHSHLHKGKVLITAKDLNYAYGDKPLWPTALNFQLRSGERWALNGPNGSGKTTLIRLILGTLAPTAGLLERAEMNALYIDQDYSLVQGDISVYEQAQTFNSGALEEYEIKTRLNRFLFTRADWDKPCNALSGGEKMRLLLCCLTIGNQAPDLIILDEPTNNLDIQNIGILTAAVNEYKGTLILVSHDARFLQETGVGQELLLEN